MKIIVEKYGGSSLATTERILKVAEHIASVHDQGYGIVVVVSAMGDTTDNLLSMVNQVSDNPGRRELGLLLSTGEIVSSSMMAITLQRLGKKAAALTGSQCGIVTDSEYDNAKIEDIDTSRILEYLKDGYIVIAAGYQGISKDDVTVLGRGGSDASATALAAALQAEECRIFSDVPGVYTADPRLISDAALLTAISYEEMIELASSGAQIMMGRAVEIARKHNIKILVGSSFDSNIGTVITREVDLEKVIVTGIAVDKNVVVVHAYGIKGDTTSAAALLNRIAAKGINIIILSLHRTQNNSMDISFIIRPDDVLHTGEYLNLLKKGKIISSFQIDPDVAQIAIVGSGIAATWGVASEIFNVFSTNGIDALMLTTSEIKITAVVPESKAELAANKLHEIFKLSSVNRNQKEVLYA